MTKLVIFARTASSFAARTRGLIGHKRLPPRTGIHLRPCWCVHTALMSVAIDIVFLNDRSTVVKLVPAVLPWRIVSCNVAASVLELASGEIDRLGIKPGDTITLEEIT